MSLSFLGRPIFNECIEAWTHGPVIPPLYAKYEQFGKEPLPQPGLSEQYAREPFEDDQKFILELVNSYYGQFSAWTLRERSYRDFPGDFGSKKEIPHKEIVQAFAQDPLVVQLKKFESTRRPQNSTLITEQEVMDALAV